VYAAVAGDRIVSVVTTVGIVGCAVVGVGIVFRLAVLIGWGVALVGAAYATFLRLRGGSVDTNAIYVATGLVVACELAFAAIRRSGGTPDARLRIENLFTVFAVAVGAMLLGDVLLVASGTTGAGLALVIGGATAAVAAVAFVVRISARSRDSTST
jgi:hypothetical protein